MTIATARPVPARTAVAKPLPVAGRSELEIAGARLAIAQGLTANVAAVTILATMHPSEQALRELVRVGLERGIQTLLDLSNKEAAAANPDHERSARQAAVAPSRVLGDPMTLTLVGADGFRKPLLRFGLADWQAIEARAGRRFLPSPASPRPPNWPANCWSAKARQQPVNCRRRLSRACDRS